MAFIAEKGRLVAIAAVTPAGWTWLALFSLARFHASNRTGRTEPHTRAPKSSPQRCCCWKMTPPRIEHPS